MRIDKFLKISRVIKRRTVAADACSNGRVSINGKDAKASTEVKVGDIVNIRFGDKNLKFEILQVVENVKANAADNLIKILEQ